MRTKTILLLVVAVAVGIVVTGRIMRKPMTTHEGERANNERIIAPEVTPPPTPLPAADTPASTPPLIEQADNVSNNTPSPETKLDQKVAPAPTKAKKPKEPLRDPEARVAMSLVGIDPEAEAYWLEAIFDSSLPDNEREDLMEDLNEEGLSDKKHPSSEDLPVILIRIVLIKKIVPYADEFMLPHLAEAYKDLVNLADITQGGGKPVR